MTYHAPANAPRWSMPRVISTVARYVIPAALAHLPERMDTPEAHVMLLAIAGQESGFQHRRQTGQGPARGLWQFEQIGLREVLRHPVSQQHAEQACTALLYAGRPNFALHEALEHNDILACAVARLALWRDPAPLPAIGDAEGAWQYYRRIWAPGKPHPERWPANYAAAVSIEA